MSLVWDFSSAYQSFIYLGIRQIVLDKQPWLSHVTLEYSLGLFLAWSFDLQFGACWVEAGISPLDPVRTS